MEFDLVVRGAKEKILANWEKFIPKLIAVAEKLTSVKNVQIVLTNYRETEYQNGIEQIENIFKNIFTV